MEVIKTQVLVLGGGPAGYVCAIRTAQAGLTTVLVDSGALGGTCLNVGCIPSKALIHVAHVFAQTQALATANRFGIQTEPPSIDFTSAQKWKDSIVSRLNQGVDALLKKAKVKIVRGHGVMRDGKSCVVTTEAGEVMIKAEHTVLATGSESVALDSLPFDDRVLSSTEALSMAAVPESMIVIGGGYIGLELGGAYLRMGTQVTIVEAAGRVLAQYDEQLTAPVTDDLVAHGATIMTDTRVVAGRSDNAGVTLDVHDGQSATATLNANYALVTVGRRARLEGWGLEALALDTERGFIAVDRTGQTSMTDVWAIGDVTGEPMLAHRAMAQAEVVAENIAGGRREFDHSCIPAICFTHPEIVEVGRPFSGEDAPADELIVSTFPLAANGRAMTMNETSGFIRVTARRDNQLVLGIQAVGAEVSELSTAFSLALEMGATLEDIAGTIHAHPTRGEGFQEAALMGLDRPLHL